MFELFNSLPWTQTLESRLTILAIAKWVQQSFNYLLNTKMDFWFLFRRRNLSANGLKEKVTQECWNTCALYWDCLSVYRLAPPVWHPVTPSLWDPFAPIPPGDEGQDWVLHKQKENNRTKIFFFKAESTKNPDINYIQAILQPCLSMRQPLGSLHRGKYMSEQCS